MTAYEIIQLLIAFENRLDVQWGVFITVHLALFGGIIYIDRPLRRGEKVAAMLIYLGFATINYLVSIDLAGSINAAQQQIVVLADQACCKESELVQRIARKYSDGASSITRVVLVISHCIMILLVLLSVVRDRKVAE